MKTISILNACNFKGELSDNNHIIIKEDQDYAAYSVILPVEGFYKITVHNRVIDGSGLKRNQILVNDEVLGEIETIDQNFCISIYPKAWFRQGENTIIIRKLFGQIEIGQIDITHAKPFNASLFESVDNLCGNKKSDATYRLYDFLKANYGNHLITGQHSLEAMQSEEVKMIKSVTGKLPAINESDYINRSSIRDVDDIGADVTQQAIEWTNNHGGIAAFCWHWMAPMDSREFLCEDGRYRYFYTEFTQFDIEYAMNNPKSQQYAALIKDIDMIAEELKLLQRANVPVLWRPLHEASGGWFWWGAKGPEACIKLWRIMFERLEYHHKLDNLIWVWNGIHKDWYPGDDCVDITSEDIYTVPQNYTCQYGKFDCATRYTNTEKIIALSECGIIPDPDQISRFGAYWSWFCTWGGVFVFEMQDGKPVYNEKYTELKQLIKVYTHPMVITLEDVLGKI